MDFKKTASFEDKIVQFRQCGLMLPVELVVLSITDKECQVGNAFFANV